METAQAVESLMPAPTTALKQCVNEIPLIDPHSSTTAGHEAKSLLVKTPMPAPEFQHTVGKTASFSGTALHTGDKVTLKLHPAPVDHGIKFKRKDLQDEPTIDAKIENLKTVERATTIGEGRVRDRAGTNICLLRGC